MQNVIAALEAHDKLAGWAQFFGAMLAILLTYFTAFLPIWHRKKQLKSAGRRLVQNGFEALESYHRTSANYLPSPQSIGLAVLSMTSVAEEIDRFPLYELTDQGPRSVARQMVATAFTLKGLRLILEPIAVELESRESNAEDQEFIRSFVRERMELIAALITGAELKRPEWPVE